MTTNAYLVYWCEEGLESVVPITEYEQWDRDNTFRVLNNQETVRNPLNQMIQNMILRAQVNAQRHYELYAIDCDHSIQKLDIEQMFEDDPNIFLSKLLRLDNPRNDPYLSTWIDQQGGYFLGEQPVDHYYRNDKIFLHFRPQTDFKMHHYMQNGKPVPFMTGDSDLSYKDGCSSPMCSFLVDKKIYKCSALGTLHKFLEFHGSLDDPNWQKYLNYKYLDLETCTDEEVLQFHSTKYCAISECDMCSTGHFNRTKEDVIHVHRR